jgi:hypothetical protein
VKKAKVPRPKTDAQILLETHLKELGLEFISEFKFHPSRKWRFDYYIMQRGFANFTVSSWGIEIEGGIFQNGRNGSGGIGRHTRGAGYVKDMEKYNFAAIAGYRVLRFTPQQVLDGTARAFIAEHCV